MIVISTVVQMASVVPAYESPYASGTCIQHVWEVVSIQCYRNAWEEKLP